jgi:hypothetical protein
LADALPCWNIFFKFTFPQAAILIAVLIAWRATQQEGRGNQEGTERLHTAIDGLVDLVFRRFYVSGGFIEPELAKQIRRAAAK